MFYIRPEEVIIRNMQVLQPIYDSNLKVECCESILIIFLVARKSKQRETAEQAQKMNWTELKEVDLNKNPT